MVFSFEIIIQPHKYRPERKGLHAVGFPNVHGLPESGHRISNISFFVPMQYNTDVYYLTPENQDTSDTFSKSPHLGIPLYFTVIMGQRSS